jgi:hypothetical protein
MSREHLTPCTITDGIIIILYVVCSCFQRYSSMDSHFCHNAKKATHITDVFFVEELTKFVGYDASNEWFKTNSARRRKLALCSSSSPSSQSSRHSTPQNSAATTPRRFSLAQSHPLYHNADPQETSPSSRKSDGMEANPMKPTEQSGSLEDTRMQRIDFPEPCPQTERQNHLFPSMVSGSASRTAESAMGRIGLLYTDAAHSVLEDRDVANYIDAIGRPLP